MASTLSGIVSMLGYRVQVAATGAEAPAVIPAFQPGVVLLDMDLPDTAGEVVLQRLLQSDLRLPVALLSGKRSPELARRALAQGAFGYIAKPFNRQRLGEVVQAAFAARR